MTVESNSAHLNFSSDLSRDFSDSLDRETKLKILNYGTCRSRKSFPKDIQTGAFARNTYNTVSKTGQRK